MKEGGEELKWIPLVFVLVTPVTAYPRSYAYDLNLLCCIVVWQ